MHPWHAKAVVLTASAAIGVIRAVHTRRRAGATVASRPPAPFDLPAMVATVIGFTIPVLWTFTSWFATAQYPVRAWPLLTGTVLLAAALWLFHRTHRDLGRNWSASLQLWEAHALVTSGVYRRIRHPMYLSLLLYGLGLALVVPNGIAGPACLAGNAMLFALRFRREEQMLRDRFGAAYDAYAARTSRLIPGVW